MALPVVVLQCGVCALVEEQAHDGAVAIVTRPVQRLLEQTDTEKRKRVSRATRQGSAWSAGVNRVDRRRLFCIDMGICFLGGYEVPACLVAVGGRH